MDLLSSTPFVLSFDLTCSLGKLLGVFAFVPPIAVLPAPHPHCTLSTFQSSILGPNSRGCSARSSCPQLALKELGKAWEIFRFARTELAVAIRDWDQEMGAVV